MKILKRIARVLLIAGGGFVVLLLLIAGLTQTGFFKDRLRSFLSDKISSRLNGTLSIGRLDGNLLTGFTIDSLLILHSEDTILAAREVSFQYEPLSLFRSSKEIKELIIVAPSIRIMRPPGGAWNIARLMKPSEGESSGTASWEMAIHHFEILHGRLKIIDSLSLTEAGHPREPDSTFEYHNMTLDDVNLSTSATVTDHGFQVQILKASGTSFGPDLRLRDFKATLTAGRDGLSAKNMVIQTGESYIEIDAKMKRFNLFAAGDLKSMEHDSTEVRLRANAISFRELKTLLPPVGFLTGSAVIELDAAGEFGHLAVQRLNVKTYESAIHLSGTVSNLHVPDKLFLAVTIDRSQVLPSNLHTLMPLFGLPEFPAMGPTEIRGSFRGEPVKFAADVAAKGSFGAAHFNGTLDLSKPIPEYATSFETSHLRLEQILPAAKLSTDLTARGDLRGRGFGFEGLLDTLTVRMDSSRVRRLYMDQGTLAVKAEGRKIKIVSDVSSREMNASVNGTADYTDSSRPAFRGELALGSFDVSRLMETGDGKNSITLRAKGDVAGLSVDDIGGSLSVSLLPSVVEGREIPPLELSLFLDQTDVRQKHLKLSSSAGDAELNGRFDLDVAASVLPRETSRLIDAIRQHALPESPRAMEAPVEALKTYHSEFQKSFDCTYRFTPSDLEPVALLAGSAPFNASGSVSGTLKGSEQDLAFTCSGRLDEFFIGSSESGVFATGTSVDISVDHLSPASPLERMALNGTLSVSSLQTGPTTLRDIHASVDYGRLIGRGTAGFTLDSAATIRAEGQVSIEPHTYAIDLDTLSVESRGYKWSNDQDVQARLNFDGVRILHADLTHGDELFSVAGILQHDGGLDMTASLRRLRLEGIEKLLSGQGTESRFSGIGMADLRLSGTTERPEAEFTMSAESTMYKQTPFGSVNARISLHGDTAAIDAMVKSRQSDAVPSLTITGTVPVSFSLSGSSIRFPDKRQHLEIVSEGFDVSVLEPLLSDFSDLRGKLKCNVTLLGTPAEPEYGGSVTVSDLQFTFGPNNVSYIVNGTFEASGNKLIVRSLTATNPKSEPRQGNANFTGAITIRNFKVESFDITSTGQLLLMTQATQRSIPTVYGTLLAETDSTGINLKGTLNEPFLSGKLYVVTADLVFPPTKVTATTGSGQTLPYVAAQESTKTQIPADRLTTRFYRSAGQGVRSTALKRLTADVSFIDRLRYHLDVETRGTTAIRMIFTPATNEELYAEIEGKVTAINSTGTATIYNEISVTSRSYYNFFKRFDATGKLTFVGPWDDPELNIDATYEGYSHIPARYSGLTSSEEQQTAEQKVIVGLKITGRRYEPKLDMTMKVQREPGKDPEDLASKGSDVQSDAISFILTGKFREDLTSSERENIATNFGSAGVSGITSNLLSGIFTEFLRREFSFIRNAEISYQGGNLSESANLRLTGEAFRGYFRVGGRILNDLGNASVSYQTSVGDFLNVTSIRNLFIELERRVEGDYTEDRRLTNNARLYYRFSF